MYGKTVSRNEKKGSSLLQKETGNLDPDWYNKRNWLLSTVYTTFVSVNTWCRVKNDGERS